MEETAARETLPGGVRRWTLLYTFTANERDEMAELDEFMREVSGAGTGGSFYHTDAETGEAVKVVCVAYQKDESEGDKRLRRLILEEIIADINYKTAHIL